MSWVAFNCKELSPVSQLDIITNAHIADRRQPAAAAVAAMTAILTHQVSLALCLHSGAGNAAQVLSIAVILSMWTLGTKLSKTCFSVREDTVIAVLLMGMHTFVGRQHHNAEPGYVEDPSAAIHAEPEAPYSSALSVHDLRLYVDLPGASLRAEDLRPEASDC